MTDQMIPPVSLTLDDTNPDVFAAELGEEFRRFGFAVISDHGIDQSIIDNAVDRAKAFFALPVETKQKYYIEGGAGQRGYTPFGREAAKGEAAIDLKEFWHVGRDLPPGHPFRATMPDNIVPSEIDDWEAVTRLYKTLDQLGMRLLRAVARDLVLPENFFDDPVTDGNSILRLLHYPAQESTLPEGSIRAAAHEDINTITLLLGAEEAGLQVIDRRTNEWIDVNPPAGCLVINVGDMLQRLTNNVLPSTTHRVVNPAPERQKFARYSVPFFLHFRPDYEIRTLDSCISDDNPNRYPEPITAQDYLLERLREIRLL
ncbi:2-oxoglutarate and iron-dependent oxygenase domain-containing protein [Hyphobacterium sp. HN65]|uniref:2-oxoglutarate-dependent ethylene/succinate-forming enzyme n=1 Tax=Hyphobacterium lacteum TaxID=3116575 RepID=A0ABU7LMF2_9PROT|nr:2-oxoglutarate and iron-dependent oxygenase domain-containing protein [Hyphobacterium sp. HN65]MEE2525108.1 2-oxoglutarate and iron-dependent oxygenase domain-containing protein [Hyphobacterium sp. HN65]